MPRLVVSALPPPHIHHPGRLRPGTPIPTPPPPNPPNHTRTDRLAPHPRTRRPTPPPRLAPSPLAPRNPLPRHPTPHPLALRPTLPPARKHLTFTCSDSPRHHLHFSTPSISTRAPDSMERSRSNLRIYFVTGHLRQQSAWAHHASPRDDARFPRPAPNHRPHVTPPTAPSQTLAGGLLQSRDVCARETWPSSSWSYASPAATARPQVRTQGNRQSKEPLPMRPACPLGRRPRRRLPRWKPGDHVRRRRSRCRCVRALERR